MLQTERGIRIETQSQSTFVNPSSLATSIPSDRQPLFGIPSKPHTESEAVTI